MELNDTIKTNKDYLVGKLTGNVAGINIEAMKGKFVYNAKISLLENYKKAFAVLSYKVQGGVPDLDLYSTTSFNAYWNRIEKTHQLVSKKAPGDLNEYSRFLSSIRAIYNKADTRISFMFMLFLNEQSSKIYPANGIMPNKTSTAIVSSFQKKLEKEPDLKIFTTEDFQSLICEYFIKIEAKSLNITGFKGKQGSTKNCTFCAAQMPEKSTICPSCTISINAPKCPNCHESCSKDAKSCTKCGLLFRKYQNLRTDEDKANNDFKAGNWKDCILACESALNKASKNESISKLLEQAKLKQVEELKHKEQEDLKQEEFKANEFFKKKQWHECIVICKSILRYAPSNNRVKQLLQDVELSQKKEEDLLKQRKQQIANIKLPNDFKGQVSKSGILLTWTSNINLSVTYNIVRKENAVPASISDGEIVLSTNINPSKFEDTNVKTGVLYAYSMFISYEGTSISGYCHSEKLLKVEKLSAISARVGNEEVSLFFKYPKGAEKSKLLLSRKSNGKYDYKDKLIGLGVEDYIDANLRNGVEYTYEAILAFDIPNKGLIRSDVEIATATPNERKLVHVDDLINLSFRRTASGIEFKWKLSEDSEGALFYCGSESATTAQIIKEGLPVVSVPTSKEQIKEIIIPSSNSFISVCAYSGAGSSRIISNVEKFAFYSSPVRIKYEFVSKKAFLGILGKLSKLLKINSSINKIPDLELYYSAKNVPLRKTMGVKVLDINSKNVEFLNIDVYDKSPGFYRLFLKNKNDSINFEIIHPVNSSARL